MTDHHSIRFHLERRGDAEAPAVLMLHGFMGAADDWTEEITGPLIESGFQVIAIDLPGHGRTVVSDEDDYYIEYCAERLMRLLDDLHLERVHLVGYSMGGRLALYLAVRFPERCVRVVLESASPGLKTRAERKARVSEDVALGVRIISQPMEKFLREWYVQPLFASMASQPERLEQLIARRSGNDQMGLCMSLKGMGTGSLPSLWGELPRLTTPLFLIVGEKDTKFTAIGREMVELCPAAKLSTIAGAGHNMHFE